MSDQLKAAIQAKIRKYNMLLELADDPEMREMLKSLPLNGNVHKTALEESGAQLNPAPDKPKRSYGLLKKTVCEVLNSAKQPITTDGIVEEMRKRNFKFKSAKPAIAVNEALNTLLEKKKAKIAKTEGVRNFWVPASSTQEVVVTH